MKPLIAFTGGHHNSALVVAKALRKEGFRLVWIGHKFTARGEKSLSAEFQEVTRADIKFLELKTGKFYHKTDPLEWLKILFGFIQAFAYLLVYRPSLIYSSGGYLAVPMVIVGWLLRIPSITHEQTVVTGWANRAITPFVKKVLLTHASSSESYPPEKAVVVGLPIRPELLNPKNTQKFSPKLLYITCGKQGSHLINQALFPLIPKLTEKFTVIHQTGSSTLTKDLDRARRIKDKLTEHQERYHYAPYFFGDDSATYLRSAAIVVSRSGAHTIYELLVLRKKAVLIPISWVSHNEQLLNANLAKEQLGSLVLEEKELTPDSLYQAIMEIDKKTITQSSIKPNTNAVEKITHLIHQYL